MLTARFLLRLRAYHRRSMGTDSIDEIPRSPLDSIATIGHARPTRTFLDEFGVDSARLIAPREGDQGASAREPEWTTNYGAESTRETDINQVDREVASCSV